MASDGGFADSQVRRRQARACRRRLVDRASCGGARNPGRPCRRRRGPGQGCFHRHARGARIRHIRRLAARAADAAMARASAGFARRGRHAGARPDPAERDERGEPRAGRSARAAQPHRLGSRRLGQGHDGLRPRPRHLRQYARRHRRRRGSRARPPARLPLHLCRQSARSRLLAGRADHPAHHLSDRRHHRAAGHLPLPQIRRRDVRRRPRRHSHPARGRRAHRRHHGRRPLRQLLYRRARLDDDAGGSRCACAPWASIPSRC